MESWSKYLLVLQKYYTSTINTLQYKGLGTKQEKITSKKAEIADLLTSKLLS